MFPCLATRWKSETYHTKVIIIFDVYLTAGKRSAVSYIIDQPVFLPVYRHYTIKGSKSPHRAIVMTLTIAFLFRDSPFKRHTKAILNNSAFSSVLLRFKLF